MSIKGEEALYHMEISQFLRILYARKVIAHRKWSKFKLTCPGTDLYVQMYHTDVMFSACKAFSALSKGRCSDMVICVGRLKMYV